MLSGGSRPWPALELVKKRTEGALSLSFLAFSFYSIPRSCGKLSLLSLSQLKRFSWVSPQGSVPHCPHWFSPKPPPPTASHNRSCSPARVLAQRRKHRQIPDWPPVGPRPCRGGAIFSQSLLKPAENRKQVGPSSGNELFAALVRQRSQGPF